MVYQGNVQSTFYHSNTYETGRVKFEKDLEHIQGYTTKDKAEVKCGKTSSSWTMDWN